jgi:glycerophosphoryl diester phosphodiesterase
MLIIAELNRRNIFRVALLYIVASWLLLQLFDIMSQLLGVPDWVFRFVFALLLICFPLMMAFSWFFEITSEGLKREHSIDSVESITQLTGKKLTAITLKLLITAVIIAGVNYLAFGTTPTPVTNQFSDQVELDTSTIAPMIAAGSPRIDLQGHRGARGLMPENSIPAFILALDLGVTTLEMDVAINAEGNVVVSHEPWMSATICTHGDGRAITEEEEKTLRIYAMSDVEVASFDCGSIGHPTYLQQQSMRVSKPLLKDVLLAVIQHVEETDRDNKSGQVLFNIEIKSLPEGDNIFHPEVMEFANILHTLISDHQLIEQTTIQSFDTRALEAMHEIDPDISIALLVENKDGLAHNLSQLSFVPQIYSPNYNLLDQAQIDAAHAQNILIIPWTVNDASSMRKLVAMGVDGLITDYPDLGTRVLAEIQQAQ